MNANDSDFITHDIGKKDELQQNVKKILGKENLKVNETKAEETVLENKKKGPEYSCYMQGELKLRIMKNDIKIWSLPGVAEDIERKKQLATAALNKIRQYLD